MKHRKHILFQMYSAEINYNLFQNVLYCLPPGIQNRKSEEGNQKANDQAWAFAF